MKKVAYILGSLNRGGAETLLLDVFRHASSAAYDIIGIHRKDGSYLDEFVATGVPFISYSRKGKCIFSYLCGLRKILQDNCIEIAHTQLYLDAIYVWLATIGTNIKIVTTFHGFDTDKSLIGKCMYQLAMWMANKVVFVSETQRSYYLAKYKFIEKKSCVVYNGVDFSKLDGLENERNPFIEIDRAQRGLQEKTSIRLAMVGNFGSGRSQSIIAKSIQKLNIRGINDFHFYFVGRRNPKEGWRYDECVKYCEDHDLQNVKFLGGRSDVPEILQNLDGFVYSTSHDTFGIAVVEAMASGVPLLVNDYPTMLEITQDGQWATLFKSDDVEDCANKLQYFIKNISELKTKAQEQKGEIRKKYSIENHLYTLNKVYNNL